MKIKHLSGFDTTDASYYYIDNIRANVASADGNATISFFKKEGHIVVHVLPSSDLLKQDVIDHLLNINRKLKFKPIFSKSLKISKTISYTIDI